MSDIKPAIDIFHLEHQGIELIEEQLKYLHLVFGD